jgi:DNA-binding NtrC family response regulator
MGRQVKPFDDQARAAISEYGWPGNVRELQNAVERALIVAAGSAVSATDLPFVADASSSTPAPGAGTTLADIERRAILEALKRHDGNRRATAEELGISLRTLQYRLKDYGLTEA